MARSMSMSVAMAMARSMGVTALMRMPAVSRRRPGVVLDGCRCGRSCASRLSW
ncbi:hypothetical protein [Streptomyces sp. 8L]|uniref:hypothetical protein n=1 Tax=Streptomyces sp. 8L TaxID=2877242 RepID=UPI001CD6F221|nr:hypothetical protein [Streptomyces sp. 8L]MCA1219378.1 hypothetical protein [Streptomyces sp. 8L]